MLKAYKYRLYPNKEQEVYFAKTFERMIDENQIIV